MTNNLLPINKAAKKMRTAALIWLIIGIYQLTVSLPEMAVGYGFLCLIVGIWNIIQFFKLRSLAKKFTKRPVGLYDYYKNKKTSLIIFLFINLILGSVLGVIGSIYELAGVRDYVIKNKDELDRIEDFVQEA